MSDFHRFAIYYLPDDAGLAAFGASWLGWDVATGQSCQQPDIPGLKEATDTPRRYGFHATLKPPFRLGDNADFDALKDAAASLAADLAPVRLEGLKLARLGRFMALTPDGDNRPLNALAARCVRDLDRFRAPSGDAELARRRAAGLTPEQESNLLKWGYPYVMDAFRFHITLTGRLGPGDAALETALAGMLPALPQPFDIRSIALVGQGDDGCFHLIHRYALTGKSAASA